MKSEFYCDWRLDAFGYTVWWADDPAINGSDFSAEVAERLVADRLMAIRPYCIPEISYVICPPIYEKYFYLSARWMLLDAEVSMEVSRDKLASYYSEGVCSRCGLPKGARNEVPISMDGLLTEEADAVVLDKQSGLYAFSERFVGCLSELKAKAPTLHLVTGLVSPSGERFYELRDLAEVNSGSVDSSEVNGLKCSLCNRVFIGSRSRQGQLVHFVEPQVDKVGSIAYIRNAFWNRIVVRDVLLRQLTKLSARRRLLAKRVGTIPNNCQFSDRFANRW